MGYTKSKDQIESMRTGGRILASIFTELELMIAPGLDVWELEEKFIALCKENNVVPSCKGYKRYKGSAFPTGLCVSIGNECVHCYPKKGTILEEGQHILLDTVISYKGMHVDSAYTYAVGHTDEKIERLLKTTKFALDTAISKVKDGVRVGIISNTIQTIAEMSGFNVLRDYSGHGIGESMHEKPSIPCFGSIESEEYLKEGMTITIEPLVCTGDWKVSYKEPGGWETFMNDGGDFAQFEHTVLVTKSGCEILTEK